MSSSISIIAGQQQPSQTPLVTTHIRPAAGSPTVDWGVIWQYRELLYFLVWRDLKVRYKQTVLGVTWAVLQPLVTVGLFSVIFGSFARLPSDGIPYPLYAYSAILPWTLLSAVLNRSSTSLVGSSNLITKVYFPRVLIPVSAALGSLVDFLISTAILFLMMLGYGRAPGLGVLWLPLLAIGVLLLGLALGLVLSALNVRFRDVSYLLSFLLQVWMFASPVVYSARIVPGRWWDLYALNPMVGYIEGFRWALLGTSGGHEVPWLAPLVVTILGLWFGSKYFRQVERSFADVI